MSLLGKNNKLLYGHVTNLVNKLRQREEWPTKNIVNKALIKYRKERARELRESLWTPTPTVPSAIHQQSPSMNSDLSNVSSVNSIMNIGRPLSEVPS